MTEIVFKPEPGAKIVAGKGLYRAYQNRKPLDLLFRAKNAGEADLMLQYLFEHQTAGKTIDYDLTGLLECKEDEDATKHDEEQDGTEATAGHRAEDPAPAREET